MCALWQGLTDSIGRGLRSTPTAVASAEVPVVAPAPVQAQEKPVVARGVVVKAPKVKKEKVVESAEVKWARRLARWAGKTEKAGADPEATQKLRWLEETAP